MLQIITSPGCHTKLHSEIDTAVRANLISSPITDLEAKKLPYLQACIKEGIRLWPPITGLMPKVSPIDDTILGKRIPAGTKVAWCAWRVFRNTDIFGVDAEVFRPDRWLEADAERLKVMENTAELAFSPGRWQCLGKSIAFIELNKVFVEVCCSSWKAG
jgi:cytochrome P450